MFTAFVAGAPAENDDCPSHVSWTRDSANSLLRAAPSYIHSSHPLFAASERAALASAAAEPHVVYAPPESSSRRNVRDSAPAFTHHVVDRGEVLDSDDVVHPSRSRLWRLAGPRIEGCVLPRVRRAFDCPDCHVCSASVRRYKPGERVDLAAHRDTRWRAVLAVEGADSRKLLQGLTTANIDELVDGGDLRGGVGRGAGVGGLRPRIAPRIAAEELRGAIVTDSAIFRSMETSA